MFNQFRTRNTLLLFFCFILIALTTTLVSANEVIQLHKSQGQAEMPYLVILKSGDILVVFNEGHHFNQDAEIFYMIYNKKNNTWSEPKLAVKRAYSSAYPQLAIDEEGDVHMTYMDGNSSVVRDIYYALYSQGKWSARHKAYDSTGLNSSWPRIQVENGKIYIAWSHNYDPQLGEMDICLIVNDKGGSWPVDKRSRITISDTGQAVSVHNAFVVKNGRIYCAWMDTNHKIGSGNWNIYYNEGSYNPSKGEWEWIGTKRLFPSDINQYYPHLTLDNEGRVHLIFSNKNGPFWYAVKDNNKWSAPTELSKRGTTFNLIPFIKFKDGLLHAVWRETTPNGEGLVYNRGLPDGTWAKPIVIYEGNFPQYPCLDLDEEGNVHFVWSDGDIDHPRHIYYTKVILPGNPPQAVIKTNKNSGIIPLTVKFDASGSHDSDGKIIDYRWDFGDGTSASGKIVTHTFTQKGKYTVRLSVIDNDLRVGTATVQIAASSGEPFAIFNVSTTSGMIPLKVIFDASESSDVDGSIVSYNWDFGDGEKGSGVKVTHVYNQGGTFTAKLTVVDNEGKKDTSSETIRVYQKPTASFTADPTYGLAPLKVSFDASESFDTDGTITEYKWDFGDGVTAAGKKVTHTYSNVGKFNVVLTVKDNDGYTDTKVETIDVIDAPFSPINVQTSQLTNRTLFFIEYINKITWEKNPKNSEFFVIEKYRIYRTNSPNGSQYEFVGEVDSNTFTYEDRNFASLEEAQSYTYAVTAVDNQGKESPLSTETSTKFQFKKINKKTKRIKK